jgi:hypothetical protein
MTRKKMPTLTEADDDPLSKAKTETKWSGASVSSLVFEFIVSNQESRIQAGPAKQITARCSSYMYI